ncbi:MAG TPA: hypothetical protein VKS24_24730 [Bradyrhizobium sp.]|nr:hypothetical protein [Bradyrhizobium sp.]
MSKRKGDPGYAPGWCIHYRYNGNIRLGDPADTCEAGVKYSLFRDHRFDIRPRFLTKDGKSKPGAVHCENLRLPTPEEIEAHEKWINARMSKMATVQTGIAEWRKAHKGRSASEIVECPACKGRLHLSISAYNGHIHGKCETEGCVSWME